MTSPPSHEERIRQWRAARRARTGAAGRAPGAAEAAAAAATAPDFAKVEGLAELLVGSSVRPAHETLAMLLSALNAHPHASVAARRAVYGALQAGQTRAIERSALPEETATFHQRQLRTVIRLVEQDLRAGVDVFAGGYHPQELAAADDRLAEGHDRRARQRALRDARAARRLASQSDVPLLIALSPAEASDLVGLRRQLDHIHATAPHRRTMEPPSRIATILPLLLFQVRVIQAESRLALLWALLAPAVLLTLISSLYFLAGSHYILDMDVPTFSLLGATTWIMFRQMIFRCSTSYISSRALINLEAVTPLVTMITQALLYLAIYACVYIVLITAGHWVGWISLPESWSGSAFYVVMMAAGGAAIGLIFGCIAVSWPFFLRFAPVLERFLEIFSGVFFVSEQVPEQYRPYFLWSPFAHGMQLLRSSYFPGYKSGDASPAYFLTFLVFVAGIGFVAERRMRSHVQPM